MPFICRAKLYNGHLNTWSGPYIKHLMSGSEGTVNLFSENLNVSRDVVEGNIEIWGKQNTLFPKGPVIKWIAI